MSNRTARKLRVTNKSVVQLLQNTPAHAREQHLIEAARSTGLIQTIYPRPINFANSYFAFEIRIVPYDRETYDRSMAPGVYHRLLERLPAIFAERLREQILAPATP